VSVPLCPVVLAMLADRPLGRGGVARELAARGLSAHGATDITLERLRLAGLVYAAPRTGVFRVSARGRRELAFQRQLSRKLARLAA
jgi:hypothetical protein